MCDAILRVLRLTTVAVRSVTYSECVSVVLVIQRAKRMRHIILWPVWLYRTVFPTISHKRKELRKIFST